MEKLHMAFPQLASSFLRTHSYSDPNLHNPFKNPNALQKSKHKVPYLANFKAGKIEIFESTF